jgi:5-methylcytosine-specific restriction protein A
LLDLDVLLNPASEPILTLGQLGGGSLDGQVWTPMSSGVPINQDAVSELETGWFQFLIEQEVQSKPFAEETDWTQSFAEGASKQVIQTRYERNPHARGMCLAHHGYACKVCTLNFEQKYGSLGHGFIHVHHLTPVSMAKVPHRIDPTKDLIPVCPNCHAMLHRQNPPLTIEELKQLIKEAKP